MRNKKAFTLIELLVVVLIIGILSAVALPQYTKAVEKARATEAQVYLDAFVTAQQLYKLATGHYASSAEMDNLDVTMPASLLKHFNAPTITDGGTGKTTVTATLHRNNTTYPYEFKATITESNGQNVVKRYCYNHEICKSFGPTCDENITIPWCHQPTITMTGDGWGNGGTD